MVRRQQPPSHRLYRSGDYSISLLTLTLGWQALVEADLFSWGLSGMRVLAPQPQWSSSQPAEYQPFRVACNTEPSSLVTLTLSTPECI